MKKQTKSVQKKQSLLCKLLLVGVVAFSGGRRGRLLMNWVHHHAVALLLEKSEGPY
jgi:hypothetical protein